MHAFDEIMRHIGQGGIVGNKEVEIMEQFMTCHKTLLEECPYIPVIRVIFPGYPIVQTANCYPNTKERKQDDWFQPAIPEESHLCDQVTKGDAVYDK